MSPATFGSSSNSTSASSSAAGWGPPHGASANGTHAFQASPNSTSILYINFCPSFAARKGDWVCENCNFLNWRERANCKNCSMWTCLSCKFENWDDRADCKHCNAKKPSDSKLHKPAKAKSTAPVSTLARAMVEPIARAPPGLAAPYTQSLVRLQCNRCILKLPILSQINTLYSYRFSRVPLI